MCIKQRLIIPRSSEKRTVFVNFSFFIALNNITVFTICFFTSYSFLYYICIEKLVTFLGDWLINSRYISLEK